MYRKWTLIISVFALVFSSACKKEQNLLEEKPVGNAFEQMNVPANFTWRTHQDVQVRVEGPYSGLVTILRTDGTPVMKVNLTQNTPMMLTFGVPAYEEQLVMQYAGMTVQLELNGGLINYSFAGKKDNLNA